MSALKVNRIATGVIVYSVEYCGGPYEAVVTLDLGGKPSLHSLKRDGGKREIRNGTVRQRIREIVERAAEAHARSRK